MDAVDTIRAFNRATLRRVGQVEDAFRDHGVSLPEARVLTELDRLGPVTARAMAQALGLDEGYLSRLIGGLQRRDLLDRDVERTDRRARLLRLTPAGRDITDRLNAASRARVAGWFDTAGPGAVCAAADHLRCAEALIADAPPTAPEVTAMQPGDLGWLVQAHAESYAERDGFDAGFERLVARILCDFTEQHDPACERGWIARRDGTRLGSIFCVKGAEPGLAKLRLFYLVPEARGQGLGRCLLETCLDFARAAGYRRMTLWTHESHQAACALYRKAGFDCVSSTPKRSFGQEVVEQAFSRAL